MGKITVEFDEDELKAMISGILAEKLLKSSFINAEMVRKSAQRKAEQKLIDRISKELGVA